MFIINTPVCPQCRDCIMSRDLDWLDYLGIVVATVIFFPFAIWLFCTPRRLICRKCGKILSDRPTGFGG